MNRKISILHIYTNARELIRLIGKIIYYQSAIALAFIASKDTPCEQVFKKTFPARYEILKEIL